MNEMFDRFAAAISRFVARAPFFVACALLIIVWAPSILIFTLDTWQLLINTVTTIVTFLLVALLQNTTDRSNRALHHKLDAILDGLAETISKGDNPAAREQIAERMQDISGVEMRASKQDPE